MYITNNNFYYNDLERNIKEDKMNLKNSLRQQEMSGM